MNHPTRATHPTPRSCPTAPAMAAYIDRRSSQAERNRIDAQIANCPACVGWLAGSLRIVHDMMIAAQAANVRPN